MPSCLTETGIYIGATMTIIDRAFNSNDPTPITDASLTWTMPDVDDGGSPATGVMSWDAAYVWDGITGWYVGDIPATTTATLLDGVAYATQINGTGGSLLGVYNPPQIWSEAVA